MNITIDNIRIGIYDASLAKLYLKKTKPHQWQKPDADAQKRVQYRQQRAHHTV